MKQTIYEEIQRMALLSRYDNSKTLSEQENPVKWYVGPKPDLSGIKNDSTINYDYLKQKTPEQNASEASAKYWNDVYQKSAANLKTWLDQKPALLALLQNKAIFKNYKTTSLTTNPTGGVVDAEKVDEKTGLYWSFGPSGEYYQWVGKDDVKYHNGKWKEEGGKIIITQDEGITWDSKTQKWVNTTEYLAANKTQAKKTVVAIPSELGNAEGVKKFQQWLDDNHSDDDEGKGKGWASGYVSGKIEQGKNGGGYGTYGPRTKKAWENTAYKDAYIKSLQTPAAQPAAQPATTATEGPKGASYTDEKTGGFYKWNGTEYEFQQSYLASDDIVYTWDGTRYVGAQ